MEDKELENLAKILASLNPTQKTRLDDILRSQGKGISTEKFGEVLPKSGGEEKLTDFEKITKLGEYGSIVKEIVNKLKTYDCGHPVERVIGEDGRPRGIKNFGGICQIPGCGRTFCNRMSGSKPLGYKRCFTCQRMLCMKHAKTFFGGTTVYCSFWCFLKKASKLG